MEIQKYNFGSIIINGKEYNKDVIVFKDKVFSPWWREEGHNLSVKDLEKATDAEPESIIIGTGAQGIMKVPEETLKKLKELNIETVKAKTPEAVKIYNKKIKNKENVIACLHLTC
jgi:hypothetical protein